ncbi:MAG: AtpZ/AtpI family protein [Oceanicaulis sp.]|nr:AtpZ/AtpI family protein [Oceanicaulis sp.]
MSRQDDPNPHHADRDDFDRRLKAKLEERRARDAKQEAAGWSQGLRYGSEFLGGVITGTALGFLVDWLTGWSPWGLVTGMILGFAAGTLNMVRAVSEMNRKDGA